MVPKWYHWGMANLTIKDVPERLHKQLKKTEDSRHQCLTPDAHDFGARRRDLGHASVRIAA